ncbi:MAG: glycosyltransferase family 87 protein, partial [Phycisphaerae bacterium]
MPSDSSPHGLPSLPSGDPDGSIHQTSAVFTWAGLRPLMLCALAVWLLVLGIVATRWCLQPTRNSVYPLFVVTGEKWTRGANVYEPVGDYRYSPAAAAGFSILSRLSPALGATLWACFNIFLFFFGFLFWARSALPGRRDQDFIAVLLLLATPMMIGNFNNLQANPAVFGCMLGAIAAVVTRRFTLAAVLLAIAIYLKIYPLALALVLLVLYPRQLSWRLALALLVGAAFPFAFQTPHYAAGSYLQWLDNLRADQRNEFPVKDAYRDLALLWRVWGDRAYVAGQQLAHYVSGYPKQIDDHTTFNQQIYTLLQLAGAALVGVVTLWSRFWT